LDALARNDLDVAVDEVDEDRPDEAGQMARGVAALRNELTNLHMLREERVRQRQQQERVIHQQLMQLAGSLPEDARAEIAEALASQEAASQAGGPDDALVE